MKTIETVEYPTRYVSQDNPNTIVIQTAYHFGKPSWFTKYRSCPSGGFEIAVYHDNVIYVSVVWHACKHQWYGELVDMVEGRCKEFELFDNDETAILWLRKHATQAERRIARGIAQINRGELRKPNTPLVAVDHLENGYVNKLKLTREQ